MVEVLIDPGFKVFELAKVDDEAVGIRLLAGKGQCDAPVVAMDQGAVAVMAVLAVGKWNVTVGFFADKHNGKV